MSEENINNGVEKLEIDKMQTMSVKDEVDCRSKHTDENELVNGNEISDHTNEFKTKSNQLEQQSNLQSETDTNNAEDVVDSVNKNISSLSPGKTVQNLNDIVVPDISSTSLKVEATSTEEVQNDEDYVNVEFMTDNDNNDIVSSTTPNVLPPEVTSTETLENQIGDISSFSAHATENTDEQISSSVDEKKETPSSSTIANATEISSSVDVKDTFSVTKQLDDVNTESSKHASLGLDIKENLDAEVSSSVDEKEATMEIETNSIVSSISNTTIVSSESEPSVDATSTDDGYKTDISSNITDQNMTSTTPNEVANSVTSSVDTNQASLPVTTENSPDSQQDEWLDVLGNGRLKKKVIKAGKGRSTRPLAGDIVEIRCEGKLEDGTVVDKNSCLQFILSDEDVIQAFDLTVALMEDQEIATVYTDARYAYGIYGRSDYTPAIPQNANITYEVEVLSIRPAKSAAELTVQEKLLRGDKKRVRGNDLYTRGDYNSSINAYKRGLKYLEGPNDQDVINMRVKCLNNLSAAQLKIKAYNMSIESLNTVLFYEAENVKALFRKGKCYDGLGREKEALESMKKASMLDPNNKMVSQELSRLRARVAAVERKEKEIYQRMFQQNKKPSVEEQNEDSSFWPAVFSSVAVAAVGVALGLTWWKYR